MCQQWMTGLVAEVLRELVTPPFDVLGELLSSHATNDAHDLPSETVTT